MHVANKVGGGKFINFYDERIAEHSIEGDEGAQWDALIRYHFKLDPTQLKDEEYFKLIAQLEWVIRQENEKYKNKD